MAKLKNEKEYRAALKRIDELLPITGEVLWLMTQICLNST